MCSLPCVALLALLLLGCAGDKKQMRPCNARDDSGTAQAHCGRVVHGKYVQCVAGLDCNINNSVCDTVDRECVG